MKKILLLCLLLPASAYASLECSGSAYGLDTIYQVSDAEGENLAISKTVQMNGEIVSSHDGTARHSSTVRVKGMELESYYVFIPEPDSYTELLGISKEHKLMSRSRPQPGSDSGNYLKLDCSGSLSE